MQHVPKPFSSGDRATFKQTGEQVGIIARLESGESERGFGQKYLIRMADFSKLQVFHGELGAAESPKEPKPTF